VVNVNDETSANFVVGETETENAIRTNAIVSFYVKASGSHSENVIHHVHFLVSFF
jgi:hypothetical protein